MNWLTVLISPLVDVFVTRQETKRKAESAKASIMLAKQQGETKHMLNIDEWEAISKQAESGTWKDEYVTIVITSPFVLLFVASIYSGVTGDLTLLDAVNLGISNIKNLGVDLGELMYIVILAAVGIKGIKSLNRW